MEDTNEQKHHKVVQEQKEHKLLTAQRLADGLPPPPALVLPAADGGFDSAKLLFMVPGAFCIIFGLGKHLCTHVYQS